MTTKEPLSPPFVLKVAPPLMSSYTSHTLHMSRNLDIIVFVKLYSSTSAHLLDPWRY